MPEKKKEFLLSDGDSLRKIKFYQFLSQLPALALLALAIALYNLFLKARVPDLALILALIAVAGYIFIGLCHRFKQRIPMPPADALLTPVEGKIRFIRNSGNTTLVSIHKTLFDSVEIRCPHPDCIREGDALLLDSPLGRISFRFSLPLMVLSISSTNSIIRGYLYGAVTRLT